MKPAPLIDAEQLRMLQLVARLRVVTAPQAHALTPVLFRATPRNAYGRLATLVHRRYLVTEPVWPERGRFSAYYYRLAYAGLRVLRRERDRQLLARPSQTILEYLLFRNEVYAAARRGGYIVASAVLTRGDLLSRAVETFRTWAIDVKRRECEILRGLGRSPAELARAAEELERLPRFLPNVLRFEYLARIGPGGKTSELVLLVVDDPRRAITGTRTPFRGQAAHLPHVDAERRIPAAGRNVVLPGLRLLLRDAESVYDVARGVVHHPSARLRAWRRALAALYGPEILATDTLFPELWAHRTGVAVSDLRQETA